MSSFVRVIKYLAIAFALFLIVTIFTGILGVGQGIISLSGYFDDDTVLELDAKTNYLDIDLRCGDLKIKKSADELKVETKSDKIKVEQDGEKIKVKDETNSMFGCNKQEIFVYLPDMTFEAVSIKSGAGRVEAESLKADETYLSLGAGEVIIDELISKNPRIKTGAGALTIKSGELANLKLEMGAGEAKISANLTGKNEIECGIGRLELNLTGEKSEYTFDLDKGLGRILLNGAEISNDTNLGTGETKIEIDGGIGEIDIRTKE
ncbi:DUF4097 family beta strand repeat protein [Candidatus Saccharibacteria bacterium]|nr:DUF4097 family beta strand repeat protein [Candidatus Saccharibacteria bacterium]